MYAHRNRRERRHDPTRVLSGLRLASLIGIAVVAFERNGASFGQTDDAPVLGASELPKLNPDDWTSSAVCAECHQSIYAVWRESLHAKAWSNGVFQAAYRRAIDEFGSEKSRACLSCHTPTVRHTHDYAVEDQLTKEGITCDFCHSVHEVDLSDTSDPIRWTIGKTKYGPLRHAQSPVHQIVNSELHKRSEFCGSCHDYTNTNGLKVLGTYSEWRQSTYAKRGQHCQDCHMPLVPGRVVALDVKPNAPTSVNLHNISGSHDLERVRGAIDLEIAGYDWIGDRVWLFLRVSNEGSGHCFPTGMPMHRGVLEVTLRKGAEVVAHREIPFEAVMVDEKGRVLTREHEILMKAVRVRSDSRLKPGEKRLIDLNFPDITGRQLAAAATLYYQYATETRVSDAQGVRIEPVEMKFLVASREKTIRKPGY